MADPTAARTKVLFVDQTGQIGGAERTLRDFAEPLCPPGEVVLFEEGPFADLLRGCGISVTTLNARLPAIRLRTGPRAALVSVPALLGLTRRLARIARSFDCIVANTMKATFVSLAAGRLVGIPVVIHLHDNLSSDHLSAFNRRAFIAACNLLARRVIVNSIATRDAFIHHGGRAALTTLVYNGFPTSRYTNPSSPSDTAPRDLIFASQSQRTPIISCFSRLSEIKGQHVLLEAARHLKQDITLLLVGGALFNQEAYERRVREQASSLPPNVRVIFMGFQDDVVPLMHASSIIVQPSIVPEGFGRTVVEAQLCGRPVVAFDAGPIREIIDNERTGWTVRTGDSAALAERLDWCLSNGEASERVALAGQASAKARFGLGQSRDRFQAILEEVLSS